MSAGMVGVWWVGAELAIAPENPVTVGTDCICWLSGAFLRPPTMVYPRPELAGTCNGRCRAYFQIIDQPIEAEEDKDDHYRRSKARFVLIRCIFLMNAVKKF